jgi:hypothetical protein
LVAAVLMRRLDVNAFHTNVRSRFGELV